MTTDKRLSSRDWVARYEKGESVAQIARADGVTRQAVSDYVRRHTSATAPLRRTLATEAGTFIVEQRNAGKHFVAIAAMLKAKGIEATANHIASVYKRLTLCK